MSNFTTIERDTNPFLSIYQGLDFLTLSVNFNSTGMNIPMTPDEACRLATALLQVAGQMVKVEPTPAGPPSLDARNIEYWENRES